MGFFSNLWGDISNAAETVGHDISGVAGDVEHGFSQATHDVNRFVSGQLGDVERAFSNTTHVPWIRDTLFALPAIAAAIYAPELIPEEAAAATDATAAAAATDATATAADASIAASDASMAIPSSLDAYASTSLAPSIDASLGTAGTADALSTAADASSMMAPIDVTNTALGSSALDPSTLFAATGDPLQYTGGVNPGDISLPYTDPISMDPWSPDYPSADVSDLPNVTQYPSFGQSLLNTLETPKGALTATGLGASLYSLLKGSQLPSAAKTALGNAGPATAQAQAMISSGGMSGPLWQQQKAGIDAQIDQQKADFARAVQQNAANAGMGGANSDVVQQQIQQSNNQLEALRQQMYMQAAQQNVTNAVAELTGGNQTLMAVAQLQFSEDQQAQALARQLGITTGQLASLWPQQSAGG